MAVSRRSIRFLSNGFHLTAPFSSNNTAEKGHFQLVWFQAFLLRQIVFVFCNLCTYFASVSENMKLVWWVLFMKGVFSFMKVINFKNLRSADYLPATILRYTTLGIQIRWAPPQNGSSWFIENQFQYLTFITNVQHANSWCGGSSHCILSYDCKILCSFCRAYLPWRPASDKLCIRLVSLD